MAQKISVIIPVYNALPYLISCLDSVLEQTYQNLEIILIDDGSKDDSGKVCDEYAQKDDRVVVIHKENGGVSAARNDGIAAATGDWVAFVDADDWCEKDYYEQLLQALDDQPTDVLCSGGIHRENGESQYSTRTFDAPAVFETKEQTDFLMAKTLAAQCGNPTYKNAQSLGNIYDKLFSLPFLRENGLKFDVSFRLSEDVLFNFMIFDKAKRVLACDHIGYHHREQVPGSLTAKFNPNVPSIDLRFIKTLTSYLQERSFNPDIQQAIYVRTIIMFHFCSKSCYFHPENPDPYWVTAAKIRAMKKQPVARDAIRSKDNRYFSKNQILLKYLLRLPWILPFKIAHRARHISD